MAISAGLVKELRERTGAGMMECKKALVEADGDIEAAIEALRIQGQAKADKKAARVAAEGLVAIRTSGGKGVIVEVNCETDFVAKKDEFKAFVDELCDVILESEPADVDALLSLSMGDGTDTVDTARRALVARIGENISIRRFGRLDSEEGRLGQYVHGGRIGVLLRMNGGDDATAKDVAMHISWSNPLCIAEGDVPAEVVAKERSILRAQAAESGKAPEILEKMVTGRMKKYLREVTLLGQPFVKDNELSVEKYLAQAGGAKVSNFVRYEVGEGIEKRSENFAAEVMAQVRQSREEDARPT